MKPKIAPTSPKTVHEQKVLDELYGSPATIVAPGRPPIGLLIVVGVLTGIVAAVGVVAGIRQLERRSIAPVWLNWLLTPASQTVVIERPDTSNADVARRPDRRDVVSPSVVGVYRAVPVAAKEVGELPSSNSYRGNGIIISNDGWIVTTKEVVNESATDWRVMTESRSVLAITEIIFDPASPFVFVKTAMKDGRAARFVSRDQVVAGLSAFVMNVSATPESFSVVPTTVSTLNQRLAAGPAALVGNSDLLDQVLLLDQAESEKAAPIVTPDGELIGLTLTAARAGRQAVAPIWHANAPLRQILRGTDLLRPTLGVHYVTRQRAPVFGSTTPPIRGAVIATHDSVNTPSVVAQSPAAQLKLKSGDILLQVNDTTLTEQNDLAEIIQELTPGATIRLRYERGGQEQTVTTKLGANSP